MIGLFFMLLSITGLVLGNHYFSIYPISLYYSLLICGSIWVTALILNGIVISISHAKVKRALSVDRISLPDQ